MDTTFLVADGTIVPEFTCAQMLVRSIADADRFLGSVEDAAARAHEWLRAHSDSPLDLLRRLKFDTVGFHPATGTPLNLIEQINQTWSHVVAIVASRQLLKLHPHAGGFHLAPGAHASLPFDIVSEDGSVVAETFAAVTPANNGKLRNDLDKLASRPDIRYRYVFFMAPKYPGISRHEKFERGGVQVWSVDL
ncbi:hypothetical protein [Paraburkholderia youngii]|uniref:Uncharacterized protein n=1 Tax=Paraburkholderia youngii TaxID=2782701 RepID=A0A7W8L4S5_9BURK|nr:hypothetical protein [Paraburkholderia youngii]MBB5400294.1 hypothetical protein [Paraburkholderia youngii]